ARAPSPPPRLRAGGNNYDPPPLQLVVDVPALAPLRIDHAFRWCEAPVDQHLDVAHAGEARVEVAEQIRQVPSAHTITRAIRPPVGKLSTRRTQPPGKRRKFQEFLKWHCKCWLRG